MKLDVSLRQRVGVLMVVTAAFFASGIAAATFALLQVRDTVNSQIDIYDPAAIAVRSVYIAGLEQEAAVRDYVLTRDPRLLVRYEERSVAMTTATDRLREVLEDDAVMLGKVTALQQAFDAWRSGFVEPHIAVIRDGMQGQALDAVRSPSERFEDFRVAYDDLRMSIFDRRESTHRDLENAEGRLLWLLVGGSALCVIVGSGVWVLLSRWVTAPIARLAGDVRLVAEGDLAAYVTASGPPEITRLGRDVEAMRKRIVDELEEVRAARSRMDEQAAELARSNADLEQFAYVASHDLQEPLRKISSFCQLLEQRYGNQLDETAHQYIELAVDGSQRMQQLIIDLLSFSRLGRDTVVRRVELRDAAMQALHNLDDAISDARAEIELDDLPAVEGDPTLLVALFQNLIGNAVKFRASDRAPVVRVSAVERDANWVVSVSDNGIGIESQYAERVFVIFQRLHGRDEFGGTGIGLALCKKIVEHHGGEIWIDTEAAVGTTVRFTLRDIGDSQQAHRLSVSLSDSPHPHRPDES